MRQKKPSPSYIQLADLHLQKRFVFFTHSVDGTGSGPGEQVFKNVGLLIGLVSVGEQDFLPKQHR